MDTIGADKRGPIQPKRVFLRVPAKSLAKILVQDRLYKEVYLDDISSGGLSFYVAPSESLPDAFQMQFQLKTSPQIIKTKVEVKSRNTTSGGIRVGCSFSEISEEDQGLITEYICKFTNFSVPLRMMSAASILCFIDSLWRLPAYFLYYEGLRYGKVLKIPNSLYLYFGVLLLYVGCTAAGFLFSERLSGKREKKYFLISLRCLIAAFVFIIIKTIGYLLFWLVNPAHILVHIFFWIYCFFTVYVALAIWIGITSWWKIDLALDILGKHRSFIDSAEKKAEKI